jgi:hypothetical protein
MLNQEMTTNLPDELKEEVTRLLASSPQVDNSGEDMVAYRPLANFSHLNKTACFPLRLIFDLYYRRELQTSPQLKQSICAFYSTLIQRKALKSKEYQSFFDALVQGAKKTDLDLTVITNDGGIVLGHYLYRGMDSLCKTHIADNTIALNKEFLYPIKYMPKELLANIIYPYLEEHIPSVIKAARKQRKNIYLNDDFNFVMGDFAVEHLMDYEIIGNNVTLAGGTKLYLYQGDI